MAYQFQIQLPEKVSHFTVFLLLFWLLNLKLFLAKGQIFKSEWIYEIIKIFWVIFCKLMISLIHSDFNLTFTGFEFGTL